MWTPPDKPCYEEALTADCRIALVNGRWIVYADIILLSGGITHKVSDQHDERRALLAARIIERTIRRYIPAPHPPSLLPSSPAYTLPAGVTITLSEHHADTVEPLWMQYGRISRIPGR